MYTELDCFLGANDRKNSSNILFGHGLILDKSEPIAQRLSAEPKGNSINHAKQDPREFVPLEYSEVTLENIKYACKVLYWKNLTNCDILASEQGPYPVLGWIKFQASKSFMFALLCQSGIAYPFRNVRFRSISKPATTQKKRGSM